MLKITPLNAIREKCMECLIENSERKREVCTSNCPLHPFKLGKLPEEDAIRNMEMELEQEEAASIMGDMFLVSEDEENSRDSREICIFLNRERDFTVDTTSKIQCIVNQYNGDSAVNVFIRENGKAVRFFNDTSADAIPELVEVFGEGNVLFEDIKKAGLMCEKVLVRLFFDTEEDEKTANRIVANRGGEWIVVSGFEGTEFKTHTYARTDSKTVSELAKMLGTGRVVVKEEITSLKPSFKIKNGVVTNE